MNKVSVKDMKAMDSTFRLRTSITSDLFGFPIKLWTLQRASFHASNAVSYIQWTDMHDWADEQTARRALKEWEATVSPVRDENDPHDTDYTTIVPSGKDNEVLL